MWLHNVTTGEGCRITKREATKLYSDDFGTGTAGTVEWHISATDNDPTTITADQYEIRTRHAPDTTGASPPAAGRRADAHRHRLDGEPAERGRLHLHDDRARLHVRANDPAPDRLLGQPLPRRRVGLPRRHDPRQGRRARMRSLSAASASNRPRSASRRARLRKSGSDRVTLSDLLGASSASSRSSAARPMSTCASGPGSTRSERRLPERARQVPPVLGLLLRQSEQGLNFGTLNIAFDALNLDAGKFISQFLEPDRQGGQEDHRAVDARGRAAPGRDPDHQRPVKLVGEGPVTVLDVLEAIAGNDLSMLRSILQFVRFVNSIPTDGNLLIPLGSGEGGGAFTVAGTRAGDDQPLPEEAGEGITPGAGPRRTCSATSRRSPARRTARPTTRPTSARRAAARRSASAG